MRKLYPYITFTIIILLFYGNTLFNGFVHDDIWQIVENKDLRSIGNLPKIFTTCIADDILGSCYNKGFYYRPLQFISYLFTYQLSKVFYLRHSGDQAKPETPESPSFKVMRDSGQARMTGDGTIYKTAWFFHLVNLLYAFVLGALIYKFFQIIYGLRIRHSGDPSPHPSPLGRGKGEGSSPLGRGEKKSFLSSWEMKKKNPLSPWERARVRVALLAALFFLTHPINSEVVNWIGGVPELLLGIFTIGMLILYKKYSESGKVWYLIGSASLFFLGLFSKETGFFALGLVVLYEIVFVGVKKKREDLQKYFQAFVFYLAPLILYLLLRAAVLGRIIYKYEGYYSMTFWEQIGNAISLFPKYVLKLFYPLPLSLQHSFAPIKGVDAGVMFGLMLMGVFGFLVYLAIAKKQKILAFGMLFFLVMLSPYLIFVNKLGEFVISERYLFLPSIGFTLIVFELLSMSLRGAKRRSNPHQGSEIASLISFARNDKKGKKSSLSFWEMKKKNSLSFWERARVRGTTLQKAFLFLFVIYLITSWYVVAVNRNKDWKDNLFSYLSIVRVYPDNKKASSQAYTIIFKLSSKKFARKSISFLYPKNWVITENKSCHSDISNRHSGLSRISYKDGDSGVAPLSGAPQNDDCIVLTSSDETFKIQIELDEKPSIETAKEYLEKQTSSFGTLINQGPALIPNVDKAYVKIWQDSSTSFDSAQDRGSEPVGKMQFFLFKNDSVVEVRVWPSDSTFMRDFDEILRSLSFP